MVTNYTFYAWATSAFQRCSINVEEVRDLREPVGDTAG